MILLPLYVFTRCYPVCFLEQLGPSWKFFPRDPPEPHVPPVPPMTPGQVPGRG